MVTPSSRDQSFHVGPSLTSPPRNDSVATPSSHDQPFPSLASPVRNSVMSLSSCDQSFHVGPSLALNLLGTPSTLCDEPSPKSVSTRSSNSVPPIAQRVLFRDSVSSQEHSPGAPSLNVEPQILPHANFSGPCNLGVEPVSVQDSAPLDGVRIKQEVLAGAECPLPVPTHATIDVNPPASCSLSDGVRIKQEVLADAECPLPAPTHATTDVNPPASSLPSGGVRIKQEVLADAECPLPVPTHASTNDFNPPASSSLLDSVSIKQEVSALPSTSMASNDSVRNPLVPAVSSGSSLSGGIATQASQPLLIPACDLLARHEFSALPQVLAKPIPGGSQSHCASRKLISSTSEPSASNSRYVEISI